MKAINFTKEEFSKFVEHTKDIPTFHSEGDIYVILKEEKKAFKKLNNAHGFYLGNKLITLVALEEATNLLSPKGFVVPEKIATVDSNVEGYTMPFIAGRNLEEILADDSIDIQTKVGYLKQIGSILREMETLRKNPKLEDFYLNDLHAANFIVDKNTDTLKVVDLDSCRISGNYPFGTKYLSSLTPLRNFSKYDSNILKSCGGEFNANANSDLYCYAIVVLNFLFNEKMHVKSIEEYLWYLNYLSNIGANKELIDAFALVYQESDNINFDYLLDYIPEFYGRIRKK